MVIPLDAQLPDGPWHAAITLRSGLLERRAQATLTFPRAGSATPVPVEPADARWPLILVAGLLLSLLAAALLSAAVRRHHPTTPVPEPSPDGPRELV